jgi:peptidoglycan-associated lipoprotein
MSNVVYKVALAGFFLSLTACGSGVKLNEAEVEDKKGASSALTQSTPATGAQQESKPLPVANVDLNTNADAAKLAAPAAAELVVYFELDSYTVRAQDRATIEAHAKQLSANKNRKLVLEGHTDEQGGREYNLALGQKRADAVRQALRLLGVSEGQLESVSYGEEKPAAQGQGEQSFARNRRVEFKYQGN